MKTKLPILFFFFRAGCRDRLSPTLAATSPAFFPGPSVPKRLNIPAVFWVAGLTAWRWDRPQQSCRRSAAASSIAWWSSPLGHLGRLQGDLVKHCPGRPSPARWTSPPPRHPTITVFWSLPSPSALYGCHGLTVKMRPQNPLILFLPLPPSPADVRGASGKHANFPGQQRLEDIEAAHPPSAADRCCAAVQLLRNDSLYRSSAPKTTVLNDAHRSTGFETLLLEKQAALLRVLYGLQTTEALEALR